MTKMLIVLEGLDGSGKTTQTAKLADWLRSTGRQVTVFDFPGYDSSPFGGIIGKYLKGEFCDPVTHDPFASTLLFAGDRLHKRNEINQALRDGKFVIVNRYVPSNIAYSVAKLRLQNRADEITRFIKFNEELEYGLLSMPKPDCIIFLDVLPDEAEVLVSSRASDSRSYLTDEANRKDKYESNKALQQHVRDAYLQVADVSVWHVINTSTNERKLKSIDEIQSEIRDRTMKSFTRVVSDILY